MSRLRAGLAATVVAALFCLLAPGDMSQAHPLDPALLELWESQGGVYDVLWRLPALQPAGAALTPLFPARCREVSPRTATALPQGTQERWRIDCGSAGLVGERIEVTGLAARGTDALLRLHAMDGRLIQAVLRPGDPALAVPARSSMIAVVRSYAALGVEHILTGADHLLFVLGLVLLVRGTRRLIATVTAFTLGHSVTLSLAVLGIVHIPPRPVEALIAATILAVALELARAAQGKRLTIGGVPWAMAFGFGLLHGLGFAGALAEIGLPPGDIPLALLSFNLGIEAGQLLFIAAVIGLRAALRPVPPAWLQRAAPVPAYVIGSLASFWIFDRIAAMVLP